MTLVLRLLVYVDDRLVAARDLLGSAGEAYRGLDPDSSGLRFEVDGTEYLAGEWNLGPVGYLAEQAAVTAELVGSGKTAIIRSGVRDRTGLPFHLLEPRSGRVAVSRFFVEDPDIEWLPTVPPDGVPARRLYDYVHRHRSDLLLPERVGSRDLSPMLEVVVDRDELVAGLEGVARDGSALLKSLHPDSR